MKLQIITSDCLRVIEAQPGDTVLDAVRREIGAAIHAPCGGTGTCKKCTVQLVEDNGTTREALACQTPVTEGMIVRLPNQGELAVSLDGTSAAFAPDEGRTGFGIACDIGTTTVVCHLIDLSTGHKLATLGEGNAQRPYGADVIARIKAASEGKQEVLRRAIAEQLSRLITRLCGQTDTPCAAVSCMAVAANTTMCHLLTGLDPKGLGQAPFTPVSLFGTEYSGRELGLPVNGPVYLTPAVSGYVGGDITADLLTAQLDRADKPVLLIDVGTNGEMALGCGTRFVCCSTAAGPAFEGAQISCGMTAAPGAISEVLWNNGALSCSTIGGQPAVGLCGSGLIDAVAAMLSLGVVDETGRMLDPEEDEDELDPAVLPYLFLTEDEEPAFRLSEGVYVTQADVRKLQLGKGAIAAGIRVLMQSYGISHEKIGGLLLAGGFGSYIHPVSAARIGLIPAELLPVTCAIGNAAAEGARAALISRSARTRLEALQRNMEYRELSGLPEFNAAYMDAMMFPEED